jgi:aspartyl-tRNA(Asn)/glutamyl-tRNA(Gln) amidotransferase subunit B
VSWEPVIGLEIHIHLKTRSKMFCRCAVSYGDEPNTHTCPICLGHPGVLPIPNGRAIEWTIKLGHALGCRIAEHAIFHRKNYFYPDLPKGYQISQYDEPLCVDGHVVLPEEDGDTEIGIVRAHLEEDAAKNVHVGGVGGRIHGAGHTLVDFNRGGTPLVEIVTQPDLRSADEARRFLQLLRQTVVELGISDAEMEKGSLRFDVNVSVRPAGSDELRTRTELKNMNSFAFAARGIQREVERQIAVYEAGGTVEQETLHFDPAHESAPPLRTKEEAQDYRYLPEPDLVPIEPPRELVERLRAEVPEPPGARIRRFERTHGLPFYDAEVLNGSVALSQLFEGVVAGGVEAKAASNVLMNEFLGAGLDPAQADPGEIAEAIKLREKIPRDVFIQAVTARASGRAMPPLIETTSDESELQPVVDRVLAANPLEVESYRSGKEGLLGFFVGQVMRETKGNADPRVVNELVREKLKA